MQAISRCGLLLLWLAQGFAVEILGAPNNASLNGQRHTEAYADAIGRAVDFARTRAGARSGSSAPATERPCGQWSRPHLTGRVAGLVLTSSVSHSWDPRSEARSTPILQGLRPGRRSVANQNDACAVTPPDDAPRIPAALTRSPRVQSDQIRSSVCEAFGPHGFSRHRVPAVVQRVGDWILCGVLF